MTLSLSFENQQLVEENYDEAGPNLRDFRIEHSYFSKKLCQGSLTYLKLLVFENVFKNKTVLWIKDVE